MTARTLVVSATNLLARGFMLVPTDRMSRDGEPVNGLFAVARGIRAAVAMKAPARAVAVIDPEPQAAWPDLQEIGRARLQHHPGLGHFLVGLFNARHVHSLLFGRDRPNP